MMIMYNNYIYPGNYVKFNPSYIPVGQVISIICMRSFSNNLIFDVYAYDLPDCVMYDLGDFRGVLKVNLIGK